MIETERLLVRVWQDSDRAPFAAMGRDPQVMATLGPLMTRAESDALIDRLVSMQAQDGHCFWAVERKSDGAFLGWTGVIRATVAPIAGEVEIGWRLAQHAWGTGYASEAARGALDWAFANLPAPRVVAITAQINLRSQAVMQRIGMAPVPELVFNHPKVADGDPLRPHITYAIDRPEAR